MSICLSLFFFFWCKLVVCIALMSSLADGFPAEISKAREGYVPVAKLDAANGRIASLVKDLEKAKATSISSEERAKASVATAEEERKATDSVIVGLHNEQTALEKHVKENYRKLLGESLSLLYPFVESPLWGFYCFTDI